MIRLAIAVEGQTEEDFVNQVLAPHLHTREIYSSPILLGRARGNSGAGGNVTIERVASDLATNYYRFDVVTSLVDYYGFKDKGTRPVEQLEQVIGREVRERIRQDPDERKILPYVQMHEFEGLLFSEAGAFGDVLGADTSAVEQLESIRAQFSTPEDINDNPNTAPSKRIKRILPDYDKRIEGPILANAIGLPTIRAQCPRFNYWLTRLESLAG